MSQYVKPLQPYAAQIQLPTHQFKKKIAKMKATPPSFFFEKSNKESPKFLSKTCTNQSKLSENRLNTQISQMVTLDSTWEL